jgi:DnaA family protein
MNSPIFNQMLLPFAMEQGVSARTFDNFLTQQHEVLSSIKRVATGDYYQTSIFLWGDQGTGKSHVLQALKQLPHAVWFDPFDDAIEEKTRSSTHVLWLLDGLDDYTANADAWAWVQAQLFHLFLSLNTQTQNSLVVSSRLSIDFLKERHQLRDDVSSRLLWGLSYQLMPLTDEDKKRCLQHYLQQSQLQVDGAVIDYLMLYLPRDMGSLLGILDQLIVYVYQIKEPLSLRRAQVWLKQWLDESSNLPQIKD